MRYSKQLTIFEGPDGAGKTTAAKAFAAQTGARYVHFPALPQVKRGLARLYVEAMLPAVLGYQDVVLDRCWLSELPYGVVFREGWSRLTTADTRMLERLALRCAAAVVLCLPPLETVVTNYRRRRGQELLRDESQVMDVYDIYCGQDTCLPLTSYNFEVDDLQQVMAELQRYRTRAHPLDVKTAGDWSGRCLIVGESFAAHKDHDPWYQWPFASFSDTGCSRWLTDQLEVAKISERELLWVNADQDLSFAYNLPCKVVALGAKAQAELYRLKIAADYCPHPQHHKRFSADKPYHLITRILELCNGRR